MLAGGAGRVGGRQLRAPQGSGQLVGAVQISPETGRAEQREGSSFVQKQSLKEIGLGNWLRRAGLL